MWCFLVICSFFVIIVIETEGVPKNDTGLLISRYAKVSHYSTSGNNRKDEGQNARNIGGNMHWNHRINSGAAREITNIKPKIAYQYPVYTKPASKIDYGKIETVPAVGEVIQSRFQAKPYFDYGKIPPKNEDSATFAPAKPIAATPLRQAPPPPPSGNAFPAVFNVAPEPSKPSVDLYTSPYSSYNPPPLQADTQKDSFPPSDSYAAPPADSYAAPPPDSYAAPPPSDSKGSYDYKPVGPMVAPTFGPPLALSDIKTDMAQKEVDAPPSDHSSKDPNDGPPDFPPRSEDDIYYPPGVPHDEAPQPPDHGDAMMDHAPMDMMKLPDMMMDQPKDAVDLPPPASDHGGSFPQYLYDHGHYDHHVYDEIPHTTTPAPATEDKRVSTTNYSYYYLGRKLWYIPLYFSIYFMVYVTVLILKAIARHKVQVKNTWVTATSRNGRQMAYQQLEAVNDIHRNISDAIDRVSRSYANMAMK